MLTLRGINILHWKRHLLLIIEIKWLIFLLMLILLLLLLLSMWGSWRRIRRALGRIVHIFVWGLIIIRAIVNDIIIIIIVVWWWRVKGTCRLIEHYVRGEVSHHLMWHNYLLMLLQSLTGIGRCSSWAVTSWWWRRRVSWSDKW